MVVVTTLILPVLTGTVVPELNTTSVVPSITVVRPLTENSELTGIVVGPLRINSGVPEIVVKRPGSEGAGIRRYGVPFIMVVDGGEVGDGGAGMVVPEGMIR